MPVVTCNPTIVERARLGCDSSRVDATHASPDPHPEVAAGGDPAAMDKPPNRRRGSPSPTPSRRIAPLVSDTLCAVHTLSVTKNGRLMSVLEQAVLRLVIKLYEGARLGWGTATVCQCLMVLDDGGGWLPRTKTHKDTDNFLSRYGLVKHPTN
jgi:hypothetical protein